MRKVHYLLALTLGAGAATASASGCELIASVDRSLITSTNGTGGGTGGSGGAGGQPTTTGGGQGGTGTGGSDCSDRMQNGSETDVDCGGNCPPCAQGATCLATADCETTNCVDGVCCDTACDATCLACNVTGSAGLCSAAPTGSTEPGCTGTLACDGAGSCKGQPGAACTLLSECVSAFCVDGVCCGGACGATCQACDVAGSEGTCTAVPSGGTDTGCTGTLACDGSGACKAQLGASCGAGSECLSGSCADGVCCNSACGGACRACDLTGTAGTCTMVAVGQDPDNECPTQASTTCGTTGTCDGAGACALHPAGTSCGDVLSCTGGVQTNADACNGVGTCADAGTIPCSPYGCGILTCKTTCASSTDCAAGHTCAAPTCQ